MLGVARTMTKNRSLLGEPEAVLRLPLKTQHRRILTPVEGLFIPRSHIAAQSHYFGAHNSPSPDIAGLNDTILSCATVVGAQRPPKLNASPPR